MSFLQIRNVSHCFFAKENAKLILEDMSLQVEEGEFISILGTSSLAATYTP
ncbi:spermidine/putrescine ABC transporter ATP-binding protein, partial [Bacillus sp. D-CC]